MKQYALKNDYNEAKAKRKLEHMVLKRFIHNGPYKGTCEEIWDEFKLNPEVFSRKWLEEVLDGLSALGYLKIGRDHLTYWTAIYYVHFPHTVED